MRSRRSTSLVVAALLVGACSGHPSQDARPTAIAAGSQIATARPTPTHAATPQSTVAAPITLEVRYGVEGPSAFAAAVSRTLTDPRGWQRAGFRLVLDPRARYRVVLADPARAERLCRPYDVYSKYSCQNGPVVVINADRWRSATPKWTGSLSAYRQMLVNHEFGHLLGMHHPAVQCPGRGQVAPVMAQQSTELNGCLPNPWPLPDEIRSLARHDLPLAPPATP